MTEKKLNNTNKPHHAHHAHPKVKPTYQITIGWQHWNILYPKFYLYAMTKDDLKFAKTHRFILARNSEGKPQLAYIYNIQPSNELDCQQYVTLHIITDKVTENKKTPKRLRKSAEKFQAKYLQEHPATQIKTFINKSNRLNRKFVIKPKKTNKTEDKK